MAETTLEPHTASDHVQITHLYSSAQINIWGKVY
jgi:hypothetical protein